MAYHFGLRWHLWNYWAPVDRVPKLRASADPQGDFRILLLVTAIPFIWIGVVMTVNRLRDAGQPLWLVLLFFIPIVNLLLFTVLCVLPTQPLAHFDSPTKSIVWGIQSRVGSAALAALVAGLMGMSVYGLSLFVALPFVMGYLAVWLHSLWQPRCASDFVRTPILNGGTHLEGTTTHQNKMWPGLYWRLWTEAIVHSIHRRVFAQVKPLAEADMRSALASSPPSRSLP